MSEVVQRLLEITGTGTSPDGTISAVVGLHGDVRALDVDPRIYRDRDPDALAEAIVAAVRIARTDADEQAFRIAAPMLPRGVRQETTDVPIDLALAELDRLIGDQ